MSLRAQFPIAARVAYLNAGTDGPVPEAARVAARAAVDAQADEGRHLPHFEASLAGQAALRAGYAAVLGCSLEHVALTTSTSEGIGKVLGGLELGPGDEILTSDEEHPGLIGPLLVARARGATIRVAPLDRLASAVGPATTLVACSHVGWRSGRFADPSLREAGVPVVLDGAQAAGAVPVDVGELRCAAYAASGQKWLCGSDGTGMLYLEPSFAERVVPVAPAYSAFADPDRGLDSVLHSTARRHDTAVLPRESVALSLAALGVLDGHGWDRVHRDGRALASRLADALRERGRDVAPRDDTTLVAWVEPEPRAARERLGEAGVVVRDLPEAPYLRASVGAWNDESDVDRLLRSLSH